MFRTKSKAGKPEKKDDGSTLSAGEHSHNYMSFLYEDRKDGKGRTVDHPDFNPTTLQLPKSFKQAMNSDGSAKDKNSMLNGKKVTPAMWQWWMIKKDNFDCILFFKVGKFYELFHFDSDVGTTVLQTNGK